MFWSTELIAEACEGSDLIVPYARESIDCGAYRLSLGHEAFVTSNDGTKKELQPGEQFVIPPGQLAILLTEEEVHVPPNAIGFISMRAKVKLGGLINVSGFHVDPGFHGRLKFSVYNAGSQNAVIARGDPVFLIWFASLDRTTADQYQGDRQRQSSITSEEVARLQGTIASPGALQLEINRLRGELESRIHGVEERVTSAREWVSAQHTLVEKSVAEKVDKLEDSVRAWKAVMGVVITGVLVWAITTFAGRGCGGAKKDTPDASLRAPATPGMPASNVAPPVDAAPVTPGIDSASGD